MLMCAGCMYMCLHACMQGACLCDAFDLAVYMFIVVSNKHLTIKFVLVGRCVCVCVCSIHFLTFNI